MADRKKKGKFPTGEEWRKVYGAKVVDALREYNARRANDPSLNLKGEQIGNHKLKEPQVIEIRRLHALGQSTHSLARKYGTHQAAIWYIVKRHTWRHLP